jgi:hypothetical protein
MFSQDPPVWREASRNRFYDDFELDFGGILEAKLALIFSFGHRTGASGSLFLRSYGNRCNPAGNYIEPEGQAYVKD